MHLPPAVALIKGDGTGPELIDATLKVLKAVRADINFTAVEAGYDWWTTHGGPRLIPDSSWKLIEAADACLKGPTTTPSGPGTPAAVANSIRQRMDLYANIRPARTFRGTQHPLGQIDMVCVREATEGLYSGFEHRISSDAAFAIRKITRKQSERLARVAFEETRRKGWRNVFAITKQNALAETDGLFMEALESVHERYPETSVEEVFIDKFAYELIKNTQKFDHSIVCGTNLFMDIISEEVSGLVGSIGCIYSGNFGDDYAMFEPAHGSSPRYKGQDKVNPTAMILAGAWMLEYLGDKRKSQAIFKATDEVIEEGEHVTYDLGGTARLSQMAEAIADRASKYL
jgi:isocitrate dehydrogenase (NAD+)